MNDGGGKHLRIFQRNGLKLDKDLILSGLDENVYPSYGEVQENLTSPCQRIYIISWKKLHGLFCKFRKRALNLVNYDWLRLIEIRWGEKKLLPVSKEMSFKNNFRQIWRQSTVLLVLKNLKIAKFCGKASQTSNLMFFNARNKLSSLWKYNTKNSWGEFL